MLSTRCMSSRSRGQVYRHVSWAEMPSWIVEQEVYGTSSTTGSFILPNLVVLTVAGNEVQRFRDFVNILAAFEAIGHEL
jgi:hypothetical protein